MTLTERVAWCSVEVNITLPMATAQRLFERARTWDLSVGGRFDAREAAVFVWSGPGESEGSEPQGVLCFRWNDPTADRARLYRMEWDPTHGGSEAECWRALDVLLGKSGP